MTNIKVYEKNYSKRGLLDTIKRYVKKLGLPLVYKVLQLYCVLQSPKVPLRVKTIIVGSLGYLISPVDVIPDFLPGGLLDDALVIGGAFMAAVTYIGSEEEMKAKKMIDWMFGAGTSSVLEAA